MLSEKILLKGHLLDSGALSQAIDSIEAQGGQFAITSITLGQKREDISEAIIEVSASPEKLQGILSGLTRFGARAVAQKDTQFNPAPGDFTYPEGFYSTTNLETWVRMNGAWKKVSRGRMDAIISLDPTGAPLCKKFREIKKGDAVACGHGGIKTVYPKKEGRGGGFGFMGSDVSSEKSARIAAGALASEMKRIMEKGGKIVVVPGPAVVHTGGAPHLASMIRKGYIGALLSGNATAAHDIESSLIGTSLGVNCQSGAPVAEGNRNHISAINRIFAAGSIKSAVEKGVLKSGILYECVKCNVPYSLAASIRDDGPLPDVQCDCVQAQKDYFALLEGADMVLMLASTLHSVAVGNMLPASVKTVCVDINPAVVTKLSDRGTWHAVGIITDVGLFLKELDSNL